MSLFFDLTPEQVSECRQFDPQIWSDLYKDAHGSRPRFSLADYSPADLDALWARTCSALEDTLDEESTREAEAAIAFDAELSALQRMGAASDHDAFKWFCQARGWAMQDVRYDPGYYCWKLGLSYESASYLEKLAR